MLSLVASSNDSKPEEVQAEQPNATNDEEEAIELDSADVTMDEEQAENGEATVETTPAKTPETPKPVSTPTQNKRGGQNNRGARGSPARGGRGQPNQGRGGFRGGRGGGQVGILSCLRTTFNNVY